MKRNLRTLLFLAVAAAASACSDSEEKNPSAGPDAKLVPVTFTAINPSTAGDKESRTNIEIDDQTKRFVSRWDDQDQMALYYTIGTTSGTAVATFDASIKEFSTDLPEQTGAWTYRSFSPCYQTAPLTDDKSQFQAPFGNLRTQSGSSFNYRFDPLVLKTPIETSNAAPGKKDDGSELTFDLARLTSILKYEITGGSETIKALLLTADKTISSSYFYGNFDGTGSYATNVDGTDPVESNVIAMTFDGTAPTTAALDAYFNLPAATYGSLGLDIITADNRLASVDLASLPAFEAGELYRLKVSAPAFTAVEAPSLEWKDADGNDMDLDAAHEITVENGALTYPADIKIYAPAGIKGLTVGIESAVLTPIVSSIDLINETGIPNPESETGAMLVTFAGLKLAYGKEVEFKKATNFNIGSLVPMIMMYSPAYGSEHTFRVTIVDLAGNTTTQPIKFVVPTPVVDPTIARKGAPDLWTNSVTLALNDVPASAKVVTVQYKTTSESDSEWHDISATISADRTTATIAPEWESPAKDGTTHNTNVQPFYRMKPNTGIITGNTYQYKMTIDGKEYTGTEFRAPTTVNSDIPTVNDEYLPCYEYVGSNKYHSSSSWCSGNNSTTQELCTYSSTLGCAYLKSKYANYLVIQVLAAGNLFLGEFDMGSTSGSVLFGQSYTWKARPKSITLHYDAKVGKVDFVKYKNGNSYPINKNEQDYARIFVAIVDWDSPRKVSSGMSAPTGMWDPETSTETPNTADYGGGKIIGYASLWIDQATLANSLKKVTIPINYYDTVTKPSNNYTLVISCSSNAYGDYMCGGKENELYVGDFEWGY